ncbi:MAG: DUF1801 domain-containing protein [Saprospiraceae bacterium]|nr:DUF1801 domain-containing protein [Saprospiraceae bacterium]MBK8485817.1 DUF1801 domain-containing protein [Saprospiraceae bacterium]MBK9723020.1 DUF1801 domain-containing protein [Saprospiraceae bacterium]MBK9726881.1 DUF1801 domain-containing protein [Saprospiraceae bacterium]
MQSKAITAKEYLESLPEERKGPITKIRKQILENLPEGFSEGMSYGMLCYVVPHTLFPAGYHCDPKQALPFIALASQKNYISLYHMALYEGELLNWFKKEWEKVSTKKLDMGKCCIRFKKTEDIPYELLGTLCSKITAEKWIELYEEAKRK